jgi:DNA-binding NarL/FixJ family response regulator
VTFEHAQRVRVLIADDHPQVRTAFERLLRTCDVVAAVSNGHDAVEAIARLKPDVAIVDLMMPDIDGLEVCRRAKRLMPQTQVVIVTAFDDAHVQAAALEAGASAFVPKYAAPGTLEATVRRVAAESGGGSASGTRG